MTTYIALLRGINVGGNNKLPMAELKALLEGMGLSTLKPIFRVATLSFKAKPPIVTSWRKRSA